MVLMKTLSSNPCMNIIHIVYLYVSIDLLLLKCFTRELIELTKLKVHGSSILNTINFDTFLYEQ